MRWSLKHGNLLNQPADVLIVSANPFLTLSGGVGGELLLRYGQDVQYELRRYLQSRKLRYVQPCDVVPTYGGATPYRVVLHAVAIDAFYDSSPEWITTTITKALQMAAEHGVERVALAALATGYGRMPLAEFATGLRPLLKESFGTVQEVLLGVQSAEKHAELAALLPELE